MAAAHEGAVDVAAHCKEQRADVEGVLYWILCVPEADPIYHFLVESGFVDVNQFIERTGTVLGVAASHRDRHALIKYSLKKGADPNVTVDCQCHIMALACAAGYADETMVRLLLDHGADLAGSGALVIAAEKGQMGNVQLLIARGADLKEMGVVTFDRGSLTSLGTPLHNAVENGHIGVVNVLLEAGADVELKDAKGRTAADIAVEKGLGAAVVARLRFESKLGEDRSESGSEGYN